MKKQVEVSIINVQSIDGESQTYKSLAKGVFDTLTGMLSFAEQMEEQTVLTSIHIEPERVTVRKRGSVKTVMSFVQGQITEGDYVTPYGNMRMEIDSKIVEVNTGDGQLSIRLSYILSMNSAAIGNNEMNIVAKIIA